MATINKKRYEQMNGLLTYLDHNILDTMTKGDPFSVEEILLKEKLIPVFSTETLNEIGRSKGYEKNFLNVLKKIGAKYLVPFLNKDKRPTGTAEFRECDPNQAYKNYIENRIEKPENGYGLTAMLEKVYGGRSKDTFADIANAGAEELRALLSSVFSPDEMEEMGTEFGVSIKGIVDLIVDKCKEELGESASQLDTHNHEPMVKQFAAEAKTEPKYLNNIQEPRVLEKIWEIVSKSPYGEKYDLEVFFGIKATPNDLDQEREKTILEKVNAIYHQLNFVGYHRDSGMKKSRRVTASLSDMTHAGMASFCDIFMCMDNGLVKKAKAAYEYLGVSTEIRFFDANKI